MSAIVVNVMLFIVPWVVEDTHKFELGDFMVQLLTASAACFASPSSQCIRTLVFGTLASTQGGHLLNGLNGRKIHSLSGFLRTRPIPPLKETELYSPKSSSFSTTSQDTLFPIHPLYRLATGSDWFLRRLRRFISDAHISGQFLRARGATALADSEKPDSPPSNVDKPPTESSLSNHLSHTLTPILMFPTS
ncbi:uncharacterized protein C8R40DRAFT_1176811 [Lentinula edodes]|uniref:uncharacterized protein n=1 Tax=Lentinula edodes TaxID=5353 RepID=UPI001E8E1BEC|nr:uncharacterized protein C8R40DRAFT_1176811 [Lentinula edodes]KAH7869318.1 hypothetical protein C8R40DRAFT_1176811 [Lentinula edodes]